jgi:hypothetical protein
MKKTIVVLFACCIALAAASHTAAIFNWSETSHDFGSITQGTPVSHVFEFTNTGSEPLIITEVQTSCGCTVADYSREPIAPGAKGFINSTYNAAKAGVFSKTITVKSNAEESPVLTMKGTVIE